MVPPSGFLRALLVKVSLEHCFLTRSVFLPLVLSCRLAEVVLFLLLRKLYPSISRFSRLVFFFCLKFSFLCVFLLFFTKIQDFQIFRILTIATLRGLSRAF